MKNQVDKTDKFIDFHRKRWKRILQYLKSYLATQKPEDLHQYRLETKKIVALCHLIEYAQNDFKAEQELQPLMKLFKLSGKLRDRQNAIIFSGRYHIELPEQEDKSKPSHVLHKLHRHFKNESERLKESERKVNKRLKLLTDFDRKKYAGVLQINIAEQLNARPKKESLHEIRKMIKDAIYLSKISASGQRHLINKQDLDELDKLENLIGDWHDMDKFTQKLIAGNAGLTKAPVEKMEKREKDLLNHIYKLIAAFNSKTRKGKGNN